MPITVFDVPLDIPDGWQLVCPQSGPDPIVRIGDRIACKPNGVPGWRPAEAWEIGGAVWPYHALIRRIHVDPRLF